MKPTKFMMREQEKHAHVYGIEVPPARAAWITARLLFRINIESPPKINFFDKLPKINFFDKPDNMAYCFPKTKKGRAVINMRVGFTLGDLIHELVHHFRFETRGDHRHDKMFSNMFDRLAGIAEYIELDLWCLDAMYAEHMVAERESLSDDLSLDYE